MHTSRAIKRDHSSLVSAHIISEKYHNHSSILLRVSTRLVKFNWNKFCHTGNTYFDENEPFWKQYFYRHRGACFVFGRGCQRMVSSDDDDDDKGDRKCIVSLVKVANGDDVVLFGHNR